MKIAIARVAAATWMAVASLCAVNVSSAAARDAPLQLVGRCDSCSGRWEGGSIYTYCELSVLRLVRGSPTVDAVVVRQRGGVVDGVAQRVSHRSMLQPGDKYLLSLDRDESGVWTPVARGVHPIAEGPDGLETVDGQPLDEVIRELGGGH